MSEYDNDLKIKGEFINFLRINLENKLDKNIDQQEIRGLVYRFIIDKVLAGKEVKTDKEKKRLFLDLIIEVINFCLSFGEIIIDTLSELKRYQDFEMHKISDDIDA